MGHRLGAEPFRWLCYHEEVCTGCGKILQHSIEAEECPGYHPITAEELAGIEAEAGTEDHWMRENSPEPAATASSTTPPASISMAEIDAIEYTTHADAFVPMSPAGREE